MQADKGIYWVQKITRGARSDQALHYKQTSKTVFFFFFFFLVLQEQIRIQWDAHTNEYKLQHDFVESMDLVC